MSQHTEIRLTGSGGQGLILIGIILAEAAIHEGKNAVQTQSYGPEARGGASKSEVIISNDEILFPKVQKADVVLSLTQIASDKYSKSVDSEGILILDESITIPEGVQAKRIIKLPILRTAHEVVGKSIVANIVALGVIVGITGVVSKEKVEEAILKRVPKGTEDLNRSALYEGFKIASEYAV